MVQNALKFSRRVRLCMLIDDLLPSYYNPGSFRMDYTLYACVDYWIQDPKIREPFVITLVNGLPDSYR